MPVSAEQHRSAVGIFLPMFIGFMAKRAKRANTLRRSSLKIPVSVRPTDMVLMFLTMGLLLLQSGDIEVNPGPQDLDQKLDQLSQQIQTVVSGMKELKKQTACSHHATAQDMSTIKSSLSTLNIYVKSNSKNIDCLIRKVKDSEQRVHILQQKVDQLQANERRKNVKITGIKEESTESSDSLLSTVVQTMNKYLDSNCFKNDDVDEAYRVGRPSSSRARPVIVSFRRFNHTMMLMKNKEARKMMEKDGVKIGPDYTPQQREQLKSLWENNQRGYLRRGKIVAAGVVNPQPRPRPSYSEAEAEEDIAESRGIGTSLAALINDKYNRDWDWDMQKEAEFIREHLSNTALQDDDLRSLAPSQRDPEDNSTQPPPHRPDHDNSTADMTNSGDFPALQPATTSTAAATARVPLGGGSGGSRHLQQCADHITMDVESGGGTVTDTLHPAGAEVVQHDYPRGTRHLDETEWLHGIRGHPSDSCDEVDPVRSQGAVTRGKYRQQQLRFDSPRASATLDA